MELGLILVVLIHNSFINVLIQYFLHTTITLLAALSAGTKTKPSCSLLGVSFTSGLLRIFCFSDLIFSFKLEILEVSLEERQLFPSHFIFIKLHSFRAIK